MFCVKSEGEKMLRMKKAVDRPKEKKKKQKERAGGVYWRKGKEKAK